MTRLILRTRMKPPMVMACAAAGMIPSAAYAVTCTASAGSMPFGQYDGINKTQVTNTNTISITCTGTGALNYTITFSTGQSGVSTARYMISGSNRLNYQIYKDSARTQVLGDGTGGTYNFTGSRNLTSNSTTLSGTIYGAVLSGQAATPGSYTDTITMTLTY